MGENTKIEWADHTFNPWMGCAKVSSGCKNCYAENQMDHRWNKVQWGPGKPRVRTSEAMWRKPVQWNAEAVKTGIRPRVFSLSLGDWLDPEVPIEWLADFLALVQKTPHLNWLLVTKRPELWRERMEQLFHFEICGNPDAERGRLQLAWDWYHGKEAPSNVWTLASVEDQAATKRIPHLLQIPAVVHGLSCEPLLGQVDIGLRLSKNFPWESRWIRLIQPVWADLPFLNRGRLVAGPGVYLASSNQHGALSVETPGGLLGVKPSEFDVMPGIDWVICGGESGLNARPMHPDWARGLRDQCQAAGVPFHFKQWGSYSAVYDRDKDPDWCEVEHLKRKFPKGRWVNLKGGHGFHGERLHWMVPGDKKTFGRLLDGREWNELPVVAR